MRREGRTSMLFPLVLVGVGVGAAGWLLAHAPVHAPLVGSALGSVVRFWPWLILTGAVLVLLAIAGVIRRRPIVRTAVLGAGLVTAGGWFLAAAPATTPGQGYVTDGIGVGAILLALAVGIGWYRSGGSAKVIGRWSRRGRRHEGVASAWQILRTSSWWAARRKARVLRPSLRQVSWWRRWFRVPVRELATPLARVGVQRIWSPVEDVTLRVGGPRTGKTGELAGRILDAPGAVIATSTRTDLVELTGPVRTQRGPLHVFNPSGLGSLDSTITFNPLAGCESPTTAAARATDLLSGVSAPGSGGDREFWAGQARRVLASLMHAAALAGYTMHDVLGWVADPDTAKADVTRALRRSPEPAFEADTAQFLGTNDRTRSSICATIMPALGWMTDPTAAKAAGLADRTGEAASTAEFDVADLLASRGTVYMLGAEDAQVAPLVTALTGFIAREARRIAAHQPGGRLDPPLTLCLDEAALICPIPLDQWTADMGGRNVTIHIGAQSRAQLRQRWGADGAAAILNNAATLLVFGGTRDPEDLNAYSTLTGERDERVETFDMVGDRTTETFRRVPVLSAGQISQLPARRVLIIRRGMAPAVGRVQMAWKRRDVRTVAARARWARRLAAGQRRLEWLRDVRERAATRVAKWLETANYRLNTAREHRNQVAAPVGEPSDVAGVAGGPVVPAPRAEVTDAQLASRPADALPSDALPADVLSAELADAVDAVFDGLDSDPDGGAR